MASYTEHLNLLKKNPATDGADTFNIETMLNENWDKIDEAVAKKAELGADGKIPPEQLPEMNYDTAGSAATVQANLDAHVNNKSNPHGVTAAQAGAVCKTGDSALGTLRFSADPAIYVRAIEGAEASDASTYDGSLWLNYRHPDKPVYICGQNTAIHSGNIGAQSVNYASSAAVAANSDPGSATLKNINAGTADIGAGTGLATGQVYLCYE